MVVVVVGASIFVFFVIVVVVVGQNTSSSSAPRVARPLQTLFKLTIRRPTRRGNVGTEKLCVVSFFAHIIATPESPPFDPVVKELDVGAVHALVV